MRQSRFVESKDTAPTCLRGGNSFFKAQPNSGEVIELTENERAEEGDGMPIKLDGMSEVTRNMEALKRALDGAFAGLSFDPANPRDVERAIREIEMKVDLKMAPYISSPGVREIASQLKAEYRKAILQKEEEARKDSPTYPSRTVKPTRVYPSGKHPPQTVVNVYSQLPEKKCQKAYVVPSFVEVFHGTNLNWFEELKQRVPTK